jgi:hypothetical protein
MATVPKLKGGFDAHSNSNSNNTQSHLLSFKAQKGITTTMMKLF